jgi:xanthine/uracil permease
VARKTGKVNEWILVTVVLMMGVILVPIVVDQVMSVNTTSWNFTGYAAAKTMLGLIPFVFIIGIVIFFIASILGKT